MAKKTSKTITTTKKNRKTSSTKKITKKNTAAKTKISQISKAKKKIKAAHTDRDKELVQIIIQGMQEKKANNITVLDLTDIENSFCNYFVICEAESKPQLQAISDSVEEFTREKITTKPHHTEGKENAEWILLDYLTIVVHIFQSNIRDFYKIENLWADAKIQYIHHPI